MPPRRFANVGVFLLLLAIFGCGSKGGGSGAAAPKVVAPVLVLPQATETPGQGLLVGGFSRRASTPNSKVPRDKALLWWNGEGLRVRLSVDAGNTARHDIRTTVAFTNLTRPAMVKFDLSPGDPKAEGNESLPALHWTQSGGVYTTDFRVSSSPALKEGDRVRLDMTTTVNGSEGEEIRDLWPVGPSPVLQLARASKPVRLVGLEWESKRPFQGRIPLEVHLHGDIGFADREIVAKDPRGKVFATFPGKYVEGNLVADVSLNYPPPFPGTTLVTFWRDSELIASAQVSDVAVLRTKPLVNEASVGFSAYVFSDARRFPTPKLEGDIAIAGKVLETKYFNSAYRRVLRPGAPGRYGAVSYLRWAGGRSRCWFNTLYLSPSASEPSNRSRDAVAASGGEEADRIWWEPFHLPIEDRKLVITPVFKGDVLPKPHLEHSEIVDTLYGDLKVRSRFFDRNLRPTTSAPENGAYGVISEVLRDGRLVERGFATLCRANNPPKMGAEAMTPLPSPGAGAKAAFGSESVAHLWWRRLRRSIGDFPAVVQLPKGYADDPKKRWPVVIFLHGGGAQGAEYLRGALKFSTPFMAAASQEPVIAIGAILDPVQLRWTSDLIEDILLQTAQSGVRLDLDRVVIVGESSGAMGSWRVVAERPDLFAGAVLIGGGGGPGHGHRLKHVPIWFLNGAKEWDTPKSAIRAAVTDIRSAGGHAGFSIVPDGGHLLSKKDYDKPEFWGWILARSRMAKADAQANPPEWK